MAGQICLVVVGWFRTSYVWITVVIRLSAARVTREMREIYELQVERLQTVLKRRAGNCVECSFEWYWRDAWLFCATLYGLN
jgi:hypothetical protein